MGAILDNSWKELVNQAEIVKKSFKNLDSLNHVMSASSNYELEVDKDIPNKPFILGW